MMSVPVKSHPVCNQRLALAGEPYPRTCGKCGLGTCQDQDALLDFIKAQSPPAAAGAHHPQATVPAAPVCNQLLALVTQPVPPTCQKCGSGPCQDQEAVLKYKQANPPGAVEVHEVAAGVAEVPAATDTPVYDVVNKAQHYNVHPSGIEAINIVRCLNFDMGNAVKYVMRRNDKEYDRSLRSAGYYLNDQHKSKNPPVVNTAVYVLLEDYAKADPVPQVRAFYRTVLLYLRHATDKHQEILQDSLEGIRVSGV